MKSILLGVTFYLISLLSCHAQWDKLDIGFIASANLCPYVPADNSFVTKHTRLGFSLGSFIRTKIADRTSLDFGVNYLFKSYRVDFDYSQLPDDPDFDPVLVGDTKTTSNYNFLDVPIEINFTMKQNTHFDFFLSGGLVNSFGLYTKTESRDIFSSKSSLDGAYQLRAKSGVGFLFKATDVGFGVEPQIGFTFLQSKEWYEQKALYIGLEFSVLML